MSLSPNNFSSFSHSAASYIQLEICIAISAIGLIGTLLVLFVTRGDSSPRNKLTWSLCLADLLFCISSLVFDSLEVAGYSLMSNSDNCLRQTIIYYFICCVSILSLLTITLERYVSIIHRFDLTPAGASVLCLVVWIFSALISVTGIANPSSPDIIAVGSSNIYCRVAYWNSGEPTVILATTLTILTIVLTICLMAYAYYMMFYLFMTHVKKNKRGNMHKILLYKSVTLVSCFALCYLPLLIMVSFKYSND